MLLQQFQGLFARHRGLLRPDYMPPGPNLQY